MDLFAAVAHWAWLYIAHTFLMMWWVLVPGVLASAILSGLAGRWALARFLAGPRAGGAAVGRAALAGATSTLDRQAAAATLEALASERFVAPAALTFLMVGRALLVYELAVVALLLGIEFVLGSLLAAGIVVGVVALALRGASPARLDAKPAEIPRRVAGQFSSRGGWSAVLLYPWREARAIWRPSLIGLLIGSLILALDQRGWWGEIDRLIPPAPAADAASAIIGAIAALVIPISPLGNLYVATSIWKTWALTDAGVIAFVLGSVLQPPLRHRYAEWNAGERRVFPILLMGVVMGAFLVPRIYAVLGIDYNHVPWLHHAIGRLLAREGP